MNPSRTELQYNIEDLKRFMALPAKEKLDYLEELNKFLNIATPQKNKLIWEKLKKLGW